MTNDTLTTFKKKQKESWSAFAPLESVTTIPAAALVSFAQLSPHATVLDVGCGTGVVAITAARQGAHVSAIDISPALLERARTNMAIAEVDVDFQEGDVEALPYPDHSFDAVLSQFGHMFAPRPHVALQEMLRVLKPGGIIAFSTWPPDLFVGRLFNLVAKFSPPPAGVMPPTLWGDPHFVREQFANSIDNLSFDQGMMLIPTLSLGHYRKSIEATLGPVLKFVQESQNDPERLKLFRNELEALASQYFKDNHMRQHYLMSRAKKRNSIR